MTRGGVLGLVLSVVATGVFGGCPSVEPPQWGSVRERVLKSGSLQTIYSCEPGRRLKGHKVLTCVENGWDYSVPKCILVDTTPTWYNTRRDLYVGDDPSAGGFRMSKRQQVRRKIGELKKRKMKKKFAEKSQSEAPVASSRTDLNETLAARLDLSCFTKARERGLLKAPLIENSYPAKYARKKNVYPPYNVYLVAVYDCDEGFDLKDVIADRLFCSDSQWIGTLPECVKSAGPLAISVRRCNDDRGGCDHVCEDTPTGVKCSCFEGFRSEGPACIDVDECTDGTAGCEDLCHNDPGSFRCDCHPGYQLDADARSCQDVNECLLNNGHGPCQGTCHNLNGTYECTCSEILGHKLAADNHTCEDVDECAESNAGCSHTCLNTPGSVFCLCPDGYTLADDWKTCNDIDECENESSVCGDEKQCQNSPGSYKCIPQPKMITKLLQDEDYDAEDDTEDDYGDEDEEGITDIPEFGQCSEGFRRNENDECIDINECIEGDEGEPHGCDHDCINEPGGYYCGCRTGYEIEDDGQTCKDVDECSVAISPCSHTCVNIEGSYHCECPPGFTLLANNRTCEKEDNEIDLREDCMNYKQVCTHHCEDTEDGPRCACRSGYVLDKDGTTCSDIDECESTEVCSHLCVNTVGSFQCSCPDGLTISEQDSSNCTDVDECLTINHGCSHGCVNEHGSYKCNCSLGFILKENGKICEDIDECLLEIHECSHKCTNSNGSYTCGCPQGLRISTDNKTCEDIDECVEANHGCSNDCVNEYGFYKCSCPSGWLLGQDGVTCLKADSPECVIEEGTDTCLCPNGFIVSEDGKKCKDLDECEADEHDCSHDCENTPGSYKCLCPGGLKLSDDGLNCEDEACREGLRQDELGQCQDIDECAEEEHDCSHECINEQGTYRCACPEGLSLGEDEVTCEGANACLGAPCTHECVQDGNNYECRCPLGYSLNDDGVACQDIDECVDSSTHGCSHGCVNTLGGYNCTCPPGFYSLDDEKSCEDINECEDQDFKHECSHDCVNTIGSYNCTCPTGSQLGADYRSCEIYNPCMNGLHGCSHVCEYEDGVVRCGCPEGFELDSDSKTCQDINECSDNLFHQCSHDCVNDAGSYHCTCEPGFTLGNDNKTCEDIDECSDNHGCSHNCVNAAGTYSCECPDDYDLGEDEKTCEPLNVCSSGHSCSQTCVNDEDNGYRCECLLGYELQDDEKTCQDIDECQTENSCSDHCVNTQGSYECSCPKGLRLSNDSITCVDYDECSEDHGCSETCVNEHGSFRCLCSPGYSLGDDGKTCQIVDKCSSLGQACSHGCVNENGHYRCTCPLGYLISDNGTTCEDINECAQEENECSDDCVNLEGSYRCSCPTGYTLGTDEHTCEDVDECVKMVHGCSHECENYEGGYSCFCPESLTISEDNKTCVDLDECLVEHNCSHICVNVFAGYDCECPEGFELREDNRTCQEIDSCGADHGCSHSCRNIVNGFKCECPSGFILTSNNKTCEDIDECIQENDIENLCSHECFNTLGSFRCSCAIGYQIGKDQRTCEDINECMTNNGGCSHLCANTDGGMECACPENYSLLEDDGKTCVEIDRCFLDNGGCSHFCDYANGTVTCSCPEGMTLLTSNNSICLEDDKCFMNNGGCSDICSYVYGVVTCSCSDGYKLSEDDLSTCIDIDECHESLDNCTHICVNYDGGFECQCNEGFTINDTDEALCDDIDECEIGNSDCWHNCVNTVGSYYCTCKSGYSFEDDNVTCSLTNGCRENNGNCSHHCHNKDGIPECSCSPGFRLGHDRKNCQDVDECEEFENDIDSGCSHRCVNLPGSYHCECPTGYLLLPEDKKTCIDVDECLQQTHNCSHNCLNLLGSYICSCYDGHYLHSDNSTCLDIDECTEKNGGCSNTCVNTAGGYFCSCPAGFELAEDEKTCEDIDECETGIASCSHECLNTVGSWKCGCPDGHVLSDSGACVDVDECKIGNGGCSHACFNIPGGVKCSCPIGLELNQGGKVCSDIDECLTNNGGCSNECINLDGTFKCVCRKGYHLAQDYKTCIDINECENKNGGCSHTCINQNGTFRCKCPFGYHLSADQKTCHDINECQLDNGGCSHQCFNTPGSYYCDCPSGLNLRGKHCHSPNPCEVNNGGCEQLCKNDKGNAMCFCKKGYAINGINSSACIDFDECASATHSCDHICINTPGSYECGCKVGFIMKNKTCTDIDECLTGICKKNRCVNTMGSFYCECGQGFEFREGVCVDVDECAIGNPCRGRCINTHGSYRCACAAGFQSHGSTCIDINECDWNNGGCSQDCVNTMGSFKCTCRPGFALNPRDNFRCQDINECLSRNGGCNGDCMNTAGSFYCVCSDNLVLASDQRTCVPRDSRCRAMVIPRHAEIRCPGHPSGALDYPEGARCHVRCRRGFKLEGPHVRHCTAGGKWNGKEPLCQSMPRPFIKCPSDIDVELPARRSTTRVSFAQPKSNMDWWRYVDASPSWGKELQADLAPGTTVITFTAWSPVTNYTSSCRVVVRVRDTEDPQISACPKSFEVRLNPGERSRRIFWSEPLITDNVKVEHIYKSREPGQLLYAGSHYVRYIVSDAAGNKAECHFSIYVREIEVRRDQPQRTTYRKMLMCPGKAPQVLPTSAYMWQVPTGCYMRYTKVFSGTYSFQHYHTLQDGYQDTRAAYHEVHPVQRSQTPYHFVDSYYMQDETLKMCKAFRPGVYVRDNEIRSNAPLVVMHYPAPLPFGIESSSSSILNVSSLRTTYSTPAFSPRNEACKPASLGREKLRPPEHSSSYVATNKELSIVDISSFNYNSYRHKLIEAALRKQYHGNYPPGNVILNSIQLNTIDSSAETKMEDEYSHSFFDLVDESDERTPRFKTEMEFLHPLDHFVLKSTDKPFTTEKHTETMSTTDDEFTDLFTAQTPSTLQSRPVTRRRVVSNASSRCPLSRVSSKSPSVRPTCGVSSQSLSSESTKRICSNACYGLTKLPVTGQLYHRTGDPGVEVRNGVESFDAKTPGTKAPKKTVRSRSPDPPGTPDSCIEPTPKKLKVTRKLATARSIPEGRPNSVTDSTRENKTDIKDARKDTLGENTSFVLKSIPVSMIPRPTKPKVDYEQSPPSMMETNQVTMEDANSDNEHEPVSVIKDSAAEPDASLDSDRVISTSTVASKKSRSAKLSTIPRRYATPPPAWIKTSNIVRSFNSKVNGQALEAVPRWGSSPPSGAVSRNSSPSGRPKTANATASPRRKVESFMRISGSRLSATATPRKESTRMLLQDKHGSRISSGKPLTQRYNNSISKTPTEKSSLTLSSSRSRNIMSGSSSGLAQSLNSSNSGKCTKLTTLDLNLSSSSLVGAGVASLQEPGKCPRLDKIAGHINETSRGGRCGSTGSYLELAQKRRALPEKLLIKSVGAARPKISTAPNSRLPSPHSKHSAEVLNTCEALDSTAMTFKPSAMTRDSNLAKVTSSRAKSEVRDRCRARSANSEHKKPPDRLMGGKLSLQTSNAKEFGKGRAFEIYQTNCSDRLDKKISGSTHIDGTRVETKSLNPTATHQTVNLFEGNAPKVASEEMKGKAGSRSRSKSNYGMADETRGEQSITKSSVTAVIGGAFERELSVEDKVKSGNETEDNRPTIKDRQSRQQQYQIQLEQQRQLELQRQQRLQQQRYYQRTNPGLTHERHAGRGHVETRIIPRRKCCS